MEALKQDVLEYPNAYIYERAYCLSVSKSCVQYALHQLGVSYKKNTSTPPKKRRRMTLPPKADKEL